MKILISLHSLLITIFSLCSLSYSMDAPPSHVTNILDLINTCINADQTDLKKWITDSHNSLYTLQLELLGGSHFPDDDKPALNTQLFDLNDDNYDVLTRIGNIEIKEKDTQSYTIAKQPLREFRLSIVKHNNLRSQEWNKLHTFLTSSEISQTTKTENIAYAKQLIGISDPRMLLYVPEEQKIITKLKMQRCLFSLLEEGEKTSIEWLTTQHNLLKDYLDIQNNYIIIDPILSDQKKNELYKIELEKTKLAIKKHSIKVKMEKTAQDYRKNLSDNELLLKYENQVEKLQKISPSPAKEEILKRIHFKQIILKIDANKTEPLLKFKNQKKYINPVALDVINLVIALANTIKDIDSDQKQKIKELLKEHILLKQDPDTTSLMLYSFELSSEIEQWSDFYKACKVINQIIPEFPVPSPYILQKLKPYQSQNLTQKTIPDIQQNIKELIELLKENSLDETLLNVCEKYFETLENKVSLHNLEPKDFADCFQQYKLIKTLPNTLKFSSLKLQYMKIIFSYTNRLLQTIQIRTGEFASKSEKERLSLYENYFSQKNADTALLKDRYLRLHTACKNTTGEKIINILTSRYTIYTFIGLMIVGLLAQWKLNLSPAFGIG